MKQFILRITILQLVSFFGFSLHSFGQEKLIRGSKISFDALNESENVRLSKIQQDGMYSDYHLVDFGSLADIQEEGKITINILGNNCGDLVFRAKSVKYLNEQDYSWQGVLVSTAEEEDCFCRLGSITLIASQFG